MILHPQHAEFRCLGCTYRLPMQPIKCAVLGQLQQRPMFEPAVHWLQKGINCLSATFCVRPLELLKTDRLAQIEGPSLGPSQLGNVRTATQGMADIFDYIIASTPYFDLEILELPTRLSENLN